MDWETCQALVDTGNKNIVKVATLDCMLVIFQNVLNFLFIILGAVAAILIIISGLKYLMSGGDAKQIEGAKHTLTYAIIGLIIVLLSFFIINLIADITGVGCIKIFGFDNCSSL